MVLMPIRKLTPKENRKTGTEPAPGPVRYDLSLLTPDDLYLFNEGRHFRLYEKLGAHYLERGDTRGTCLAVWAPNARSVSVIGDFNAWNTQAHPLRQRAQSGLWEGFISELTPGALYKYHIESQFNHYRVDKSDPLAFQNELSPHNASLVNPLTYAWSDLQWMQTRAERNALSAPISIYEVHLGSWKRVAEEQQRFLTYREIAPLLADYVNQMGFTHVEMLPLMEHPFYGSWGYQTTGYFAPTGRYGPPTDLMYLIDYLHQKGIGVILDWVPSHFPDDEHGLNYFDGTHLYEHADPRRAIHPDWDSLIFNYERHEVRSFLISSALFWLDKYHADGLRVDAVASMLYLDYSRKKGEWKPNRFGRNENLEALEFLKSLNQAVYRNFPDVHTFAEESSAWPQVSRPVHLGGLGFGFKWDMGWMHDSLRYLAQDPIYRKYHHNEMTFRGFYSLLENYVLPLSHDEVVHGKSSLLAKMPGPDEAKFANLRLLFGFQFAQNGKKLLFMGGEFGQRKEWDHDSSLEWQLLEYPSHQGLQRWVADLNRVYRAQKALFEADYSPSGFQWIDANDIEHSTYSFLRRSSPAVVASAVATSTTPASTPAAAASVEVVLVVFNCTPLVRYNFKIGVPQSGLWQEILNSDALEYGGRGIGNLGQAIAGDSPSHGQPCSLSLTLPPLGVLFLKPLTGEIPLPQICHLPPNT
jgi:1,4-alpha-glucan branching enzyme